MAGNKEQFERAMDHWRELKKTQAISAPPKLGTIAILCSGVAYNWRGVEDDARPPINETERRRFRREAGQLAVRAQDEMRSVEVIYDVTPADFRRVLTDPYFSDVITIGHGSLSRLEIHDATGKDIFFEWNDVVNAADHVKQGLFIQRQCGGAARHLPVPLGMFACADFTNVVAATGKGFEPRDLDCPVNDDLAPVFDIPNVSYKDIRAINEAYANGITDGEESNMPVVK